MSAVVESHGTEGVGSSHMLVVSTSALAPGFRLGGVSTTAVETAEAAEHLVLELLADPNPPGVIALHQPFLDAFEPRLRRRLDALSFPLVVGMPAGAPRDAEGARRARLARMLWQAVGYEITFDDGGGR